MRNLATLSIGVFLLAAPLAAAQGSGGNADAAPHAPPAQAGCTVNSSRADVGFGSQVKEGETIRIRSAAGYRYLRCQGGVWVYGAG